MYLDGFHLTGNLWYILCHVLSLRSCQVRCSRVHSGGRHAAAYKEVMEHILSSSGADVEGAVDKYLARCKNIGFDVIEISPGILSLPGDDWLRLPDRVH